MSERKILTLEQAAVDPSTGEFSGYGAVFGNVDDGKDVIERGFFSDVIDEFTRDGFLGWQHDWSNPVAIPSKAAEDNVGLAINAIFHSTPRAQEARTITAERLAAGKSMGLSIGYEIAKGGSKQRDDGVRVLTKASRLFEVSLVTVPMNRLAGVTSVKSNEPYAEHAERVLVELRSLLDRSSNLIDLRTKDGRVISAANRDRLGGLHEVASSTRDAIASLVADLEDLLASTDPEKDKGVSMEVWSAHLQLMERLDELLI